MNTFQVKIKKAHLIWVCLFLVIIVGCKKKEEIRQVPVAEQLQSKYKNQLDSCIASLENFKKASTQEQFLKHYKQSRTHFKCIEPILAFTDKENYKSLNAPNILKVEEEDATDIKIKKPFGFQVIEELIFEDSLDIKNLQEVANKTQDRLKLIQANVSLKLKDYHIIWMIRDEIARIALTGITGFDSPVLEASLDEAVICYGSLNDIMNLYQSEFTSVALYNQFKMEIESSMEQLQASDFDTFDRFQFIKEHSHKQLELLYEIQKDWEVQFPFELAFKNDMTSLFSNNTFNLDFYSDYPEVDSLKALKTQLGKQLFNDTRLSKDNTMSCATCHHSDKAFTDGKKVFPKQLRNTPTLPYAALQQSFFYDGRTGNLEGQIVDVVNNNNEFHSNLVDLEAMVSNDSIYTKQFKSIYKKGVTQNNVRNSIAVYVRSLGDFSSKFDKNINDIESNLTDSEVRGFNLFMGKAKCATCHFAPVFNGTVPPNFTESEFELLGVPKDTISKVVDTDLGRYDVFQTEERKHFFKTPTIRNISKTGPYMHNGVYETLDQVMTFYNDGGGAGLGMELEYQTLPTDPLNLTEQEMDDIIAFMSTLEDQPKS
ncbi:c-type cytochrome [Mangrovimonas sp. AS39]|uniref:cytochrome-c peroxidase n=1 Tax=Mangrovimonas futianensis TaxID=2895523 RepID=UPI001E427410|nr:cytochrome c peroxidase [Mangrovimonas futianensis]MCF1191845.1 c-type cytochrome [Mangrovimonas futianensis]MCF1195267.1 c-type cytochrome [Mangrovimonas futianensis]